MTTVTKDGRHVQIQAPCMSNPDTSSKPNTDPNPEPKPEVTNYIY